VTSRDFCYWLQGLFELGDPKALDEKQTDLVKRHLAMVFKHEIDPSAGPPEVQAVLDAIHEGKEPAKPPTFLRPPHGPGGPVYRW
jgi:hypothetical protein